MTTHRDLMWALRSMRRDDVSVRLLKLANRMIGHVHAGDADRARAMLRRIAAQVERDLVDTSGAAARAEAGGIAVREVG